MTVTLSLNQLLLFIFIAQNRLEYLRKTDGSFNVLKLFCQYYLMSWVLRSFYWQQQKYWFMLPNIEIF